MFEYSDKKVRKFESDLKQFAEKAFPFATKATVNRGAFEARRKSKDLIEEKFVTRNKFTANSVRVEQARTLNVRDQEAIVGSIAEYLETQEFGGVERGGRGAQPIATSYSAGLSEGARPRTRLPKRPNRMAQISLARRRGGPGGRKARNAAAVSMAVESGDKFVYLDLGRRRGLFKITGGKRKPRVKMLWDLSRRSVRIPRSPWLRPSVDAIMPHMPRYYQDALEFQLKRRGLLGR